MGPRGGRLPTHGVPELGCVAPSCGASVLPLGVLLEIYCLCLVAEPIGMVMARGGLLRGPRVLSGRGPGGRLGCSLAGTGPSR